MIYFLFLNKNENVDGTKCKNGIERIYEKKA